MIEKHARIGRAGWYTFWLLNLLLLFFAWLANRADALMGGGGSALIAYGALFGLVGGFFLLIQFFLISGLPIIEKCFGYDHLTRMHHKNGFLAWLLITLHVPVIILGYSQLSGQGIIAQYLDLIGSFRGVLLASFSVIALYLVGISSWIIVRRRLKYEWWRAVHFLVYLIIVLVVWHQIYNGGEFLAYAWLKNYWLALYFMAIASVIYMRWLRPYLFWVKYRWRVSEVRAEGSNVTSIYVTSPRSGEFKYHAGQFNLWKFWQKGFRLQKHPFTISSSPGEKYLRISAKASGDFTAALPQIKKGAPVIINGPFGRFTMLKSHGKPRLFIAGGIGITPIVSMLNYHMAPNDILLYSARSENDAVFKTRFTQLQKRGLKIHYIFSEQRTTWAIKGQLNRQIIKKLVPDVPGREVWLCGPPAMMKAVAKDLIALGVPKNLIYTEEFSL